jgi:peptidoglycan/LPS O-acetylase OafA/YrhL
MSCVAVEHLKVDTNANAEVRVLPAPGPRFYRPELDVLRFFAFLSVFLYHALPGFLLENHSGMMRRLALYETQAKDAGTFGVCLFFMLSAYLITELLAREEKRAGKVDVRSFYVRRMLRIWPLYFSFLVFGVALGWMYRPYWMEARGIVKFLFLAGNWSVNAGLNMANPIAPLWSVSVEEQFYLLWPVIASFGGRRWIRLVSALLFPAAMLRIYFASRVDATVIRFDSLAQFLFFALGAVLALQLRGRVLTIRPIIRVLVFLAGVGCWLLANFGFHVDGAGMVPSPASMLTGYGFVALGCVLLFAAFLGAPPRWFPQWLIYLGKISYGLYVFHMLALDITGPLLWNSAAGKAALQAGWGIAWLILRALLVVVTALGGTVLLAMLSYRFLETPFLKLKQRFTLVPSRSV